jgi:hypothetical protein
MWFLKCIGCILIGFASFETYNHWFSNGSIEYHREVNLSIVSRCLNIHQSEATIPLIWFMFDLSDVTLASLENPFRFQTSDRPWKSLVTLNSSYSWRINWTAMSRNPFQGVESIFNATNQRSVRDNILIWFEFVSILSIGFRSLPVSTYLSWSRINFIKVISRSNT